MFRIAVCDDEEVIATGIEEVILQYAKYSGEAIEVEVYTSTTELYMAMQSKEHFDLIFLDIEFKDLSGIEIGRKIRDELDNQLVQIVYISAKDDYYFELFEIRPMNFLPKPIDKNKVIENIEKCMKLIGWTNTCFIYKKGHQNYKVPIQNIIYFESIGRKIKMLTTQVEVVFYGKIEEIYEELQDHGFIDVHRSYIVNYHHIIQFKYDEVITKDGSTLPISQPKRKKVRMIQLTCNSKEIK